MAWKNQHGRIRDLRKRIRTLHGQGLSQREIGDIVGYKRPSLSYHYKALGLPPVNNGGRPKSNKINHLSPIS